LGLLVLIGTIIDLFLMSKFDSVDNLTIYNAAYNHLVNNGEMTSQPESRRISRYFSLNRTSRIIFLAEFSALKSLHRIFILKEKNQW